MSFNIGFDTILLLIATIIQNDRMHNSAKSLKFKQPDVSINLRISNKEKRCFFFFFLIPYSDNRYILFDIGSDTNL